MDDFDHDVPTCYVCSAILNTVGRCTSCDEVNAEYTKSLQEAKEKYPDACDRCLGCGSITESYDPSPSGVGLSTGYMYDTYECPSCVEKGNCPRCGGKVVVSDKESSDDDMMMCAACTWNNSDTATVLPASPW